MERRAVRADPDQLWELVEHGQQRLVPRDRRQGFEHIVPVLERASVPVPETRASDRHGRTGEDRQLIM